MLCNGTSIYLPTPVLFLNRIISILYSGFRVCNGFTDCLNYISSNENRDMGLTHVVDLFLFYHSFI